jgi:hypothetical protein
MFSTPPLSNRLRLLARHASVAACVLAFVGIAAAPAFATIATDPKPNMWGVDDRVWGMTRIGDILYVGGSFTQAVAPDGTTVPRDHLAAIDVSTGALTSWNPGADGVVYALANDGTNVFVGGDFTTVGGVSRARMAEVDPSGNVLPFVADATRKVRALAISGSTLYMGGQFDRVTDSSGKSERRIRIAGIDLSTDTLTDLKATPNKSVLSIAVVPNGGPQAGNLVVGGIFTSMDGDASQQRITELTPTGAVAGWSSHPIDLIWTVEIVNGTVFAGRGGKQGGSLTAYDLNGNLKWNHHADGDVQALTFANGQVIAGGHFGNIDNQHIPRLAAFSPSGAPDTSWVPKPNSVKGVWALVSTSSAIDVGGDFTTVNGQPASHVAELAVT